MTKQTSWWIVGAVTLFLIGTCGVVVSMTEAPNPGFKDAAATLTFITGAAVAIERIMEAIWTFLGGVLGGYWRLTAINRQVKNMVEDLETALKPFHKKAQLGLDDFRATGSACWHRTSVCQCHSNGPGL